MSNPEFRFIWSPDVDCRDWEGQYVPDVVEECTLEVLCASCGHWEVKDSLCGIADADDSYRREVEANMLVNAGITKGAK